MDRTLELFRPFPANTLSQGFAQNANISYARDGLVGHTAQDYGVPYGTQIPCSADNSYCYSLMNDKNPDPMRYRAVFTLVETKTGVYEISYGHCSEMTAEVGKTYKAGDIIGRIGNTGTVFSGNHEVTKEEKLAGSHAGAHLHGPQVRPVKKVTKITKGKIYLYDQNGRLNIDGYYFEVLNYENGTNGTVDPRNFLSIYSANEAQQIKSNLTKQVSILKWIVALLTKKK